MTLPTTTFQGLGTATDQQLLRPLLDHTLGVVANEFASRRAGEVLSSTSWIIVWHGPEDLERKSGKMCVRTPAGITELHLLAPSAYPTSSRGFPPEYPEWWHRKNLIHECTAAFMFHYRPPAPRWPLEPGAPDWFREGLQEFVAIERSPNLTRDSYRSRYLQRDIASTVEPNFHNVADPYIDGYLILRFLHDAFGAEPIHAVLDRAQPDFWTTVEDRLGAPRSRLYSRWQTWAASHVT